jgi:hypothetical protein
MWQHKSYYVAGFGFAWGNIAIHQRRNPQISRNITKTDSKMDTPTPISDWLAALSDAGIDPKTLASYRRGLEHFITWNRPILRR